MLKKHALILGGNTHLGKFLVKAFKRKSLAARWKVLSVDSEVNLEAADSLVLDPKLSLAEQAEEALRKAKEFAEEFDAIVVARAAGDFQQSRIRDDDVFAKFEEAHNQNVGPALVASKVAASLLAPCGLLVLQSSLEAFERTNPFNFAVNLAKAEVCAIALNMAELKEMPANCVVSTILPSVLDTPENRKLKPGVDASDWDNCEHVADILKLWCDGESRPDNRAFLAFERASKKMTFPKYV